MSPEEELRSKLRNIPAGKDGWRAFEDVGTEILTFLFVPPLTAPHRQARTYSGTDRRDAIFPNRNLGTGEIWGNLRAELDARLVLVEFKNYKDPVGKDEVNQSRNYLTQTIGRLGLVVCRVPPDAGAHQKRNTIYSEEKKVILFLTDEHLFDMLYRKERGENPSDLVMDLVERFYIAWE